MGLLIDAPGDIVEIADDKRMALPLEVRNAEEHTISGLAEAGGTLYRIVDVHAITKRFTDSGASAADATSLEEEENG
jgi:chemotaxis signal transduction protein